MDGTAVEEADCSRLTPPALTAFAVVFGLFFTKEQPDKCQANNATREKTENERQCVRSRETE